MPCASGSDGSRFTDQADYARKSFSQELVGRDKRLEQSIRGLNYLYDGEVTVARLGIANLTGYHMIKFSQDGKQYENGKNTNSISIIRYAEVLLNYAEAQADLNGDGVTDVCILTPGSNASSGFAGTTVELKVVFENESEVSTEAFKEDGTLKASYYAVGSDQTGYDLYWFPGEERIWYDDDRQYLYPIPALEIRNYLAAGYTLTQNPGWTN